MGVAKKELIDGLRTRTVLVRVSFTTKPETWRLLICRNAKPFESVVFEKSFRTRLFG